MEKGYFNTRLQPEEIALSHYISQYVSAKEQDPKPNLLRLAKIIVQTVLKMKLKIRLFWYDMGCLTVVQPQVPIQYDLESERTFLEKVLGEGRRLEELDAAIDEAIATYPKTLTGQEIRKRQYELLNDPLYLSKIELEEYVENPFLFQNKEDFLDIMTNFIIQLPENRNYEEFNILVNKFAVTTNSILSFAQTSKEMYSHLAHALESLLQNLSALNACFKALPGFEHLFTSDINPKDLGQRSWNARNAIIILEQDLINGISSESTVELVPNEFNTNIYPDFAELISS